MSKYKMICLDIDGTLVTSQHKISPRTKEAIRIASNEMNIPVILVSARPPKGILFLLEELNIVQPIICYSGAVIVDENRNQLFNRLIEPRYVKQICSAASETGVHVSIYKGDEWYVEGMDYWAKQESEITNMLPEIANLDQLIDCWEKDKTGPNKVMCMGEPGRIQELYGKVTGDKLNDLNIYPSKPTYLEIMPKEASKTSAIEFLCRRFDLQSTEIIAVGDNYNDVDMIKFAGLGVAMGNAPDPVKQSADAVTLSNDEDGVAVVIEKYVLSL